MSSLGPIDDTWTVTGVVYATASKKLSTTRHDIGGVTVSDGGSGSFSASGTNVVSAKFQQVLKRNALLLSSKHKFQK